MFSIIPILKTRTNKIHTYFNHLINISNCVNSNKEQTLKDTDTKNNDGYLSMSNY